MKILAKDLRDGDIVDILPTLAQLEDEGTPVDYGEKVSAQYNYWVVDDQLTPFAIFEGKRVDATSGKAEGVTVNFGQDGIWDLPAEIEVEVVSRESE